LSASFLSHLTPLKIRHIIFSLHSHDDKKEEDKGQEEGQVCLRSASCFEVDAVENILSMLAWICAISGRVF
jgi:hypothetical protein